MTDTETWKEIPNHPKYMISNHGRVKSFHRKKPKILKTILSGSGYCQVILYSDKRSPHYVHRLVAESFIANDENKDEINHIDKDKLNNHVNNLEWVTRRENIRHAKARKGLVGEDSPRAVLSNIDALEIRNRYNSGRAFQVDLAEEFGVSTSLICEIIKNRRYDIDDEVVSE